MTIEFSQQQNIGLDPTGFFTSGNERRGPLWPGTPTPTPAYSENHGTCLFKSHAEKPYWILHIVIWLKENYNVLQPKWYIEKDIFIHTVNK